MKNLAVLAMVILIISCSKNEIKPVQDINPVSIEKQIEAKGTIYLVTYEHENIVSGQTYATNEDEIIKVCENLLSNYIEIQYIEVHFDKMFIDCSVLIGSEFKNISLKLYSFERVGKIINNEKQIYNIRSTAE